MSWDTVTGAARVVAELTGADRHDAAVVLGSGLSGYAASAQGAVEIPYRDIPHFPSPEVAGHAGTLYSIPVGGGRVLAFAGRVHTYEGWDMADVVFGVRTAAAEIESGRGDGS